MMKIVVVENPSISVDVIVQAIPEQSSRFVYFPSVIDGIKHVFECPEPFIWISEVVSTAEVGLRELHRAFQLTHLKGLVLLSHYNDDIVDGARQIAKLSGQRNIAGLSLPASADSIREIINQVLDNCDRFKFVPTSDNRQEKEIPDLWKAIENGGLIPFYQAKYSLDSGEITGFEILSRVDYGDVFYTPDRFIHKLITGKDLSQFTYVVLETALQEFSQARFFEGTLSLNVDYKSLEELDFSGKIIEILTKYNFAPERLIIEITEDNPRVNIHVIRSLTFFRMQGCSVSVDDFGMKHTGFSELFQLPFSEIKIDKSFVQDMLASNRSLKVVKALCAVAQSLGYTIVAEGVETEEQKQKLKELNVDLVQGYLYSKPQPIAEALLLMECYRSRLG